VPAEIEVRILCSSVEIIGKAELFAKADAALHPPRLRRLHVADCFGRQDRLLNSGIFDENDAVVVRDDPVLRLCQPDVILLEAAARLRRFASAYRSKAA
jgi:hypothetical protein